MRERLVPQFDAESYLFWEGRQRDRFELHDGYVVAFAGGTVDHDRIAFNLRTAFERLFPAPCRSIGSDVKVRVTARRYFYPDAGVTCAEEAGDETLVTRPRVVAEVSSLSTRSYDAVDERAAYRAVPSLEAYLVVHTAVRRLEIDRRGADGAWVTTIVDGGDVALGADSLSLDDVDARTSIR